MANQILLRNRRNPALTRTFTKIGWDNLLPNDPYKLEWEYAGNISINDHIPPKSETTQKVQSNQPASTDYIPPESLEVMQKLDSQKKTESDENLRANSEKIPEEKPGERGGTGAGEEAIRAESIRSGRDHSGEREAGKDSVRTSGSGRAAKQSGKGIAATKMAGKNKKARGKK